MAEDELINALIREIETTRGIPSGILLVIETETMINIHSNANTTDALKLLLLETLKKVYCMEEGAWG